MKVWMMAGAVALLLAGCKTGTDSQLNMKAQQKAITIQQLDSTLDKVQEPPADRSIMDQSDDQIIAWIKQVDNWTRQVLSSPLSGQLDEQSRKAVQAKLNKLYSLEMSDALFASSFNYDPATGTYQALSNDAMLSLRHDWSEYDLKKTQPSPNQYTIDLIGSTRLDHGETGMRHMSAYEVRDGKLVITGFQTTP